MTATADDAVLAATLLDDLEELMEKQGPVKSRSKRSKPSNEPPVMVVKDPFTVGNYASSFVRTFSRDGARALASSDIEGKVLQRATTLKLSEPNRVAAMFHTPLTVGDREPVDLDRWLWSHNGRWFSSVTAILRLGRTDNTLGRTLHISGVETQKIVSLGPSDIRVSDQDLPASRAPRCPAYPVSRTRTIWSSRDRIVYLDQPIDNAYLTVHGATLVA